LHSYELPPWVGLTIAVIVSGGAFWKGGREEQIAAGGLILSWVATEVLLDPRWLGPQWGAFGADTCLLIVLTAIAMRTARFWPLFAAAFQLLCVVIHVARMVDPGVHAWAYATGQVIFSQWVFFSVGVGVFTAWRRSRQLPTSDPLTAESGATRR
jgi:hypothetical protein